MERDIKERSHNEKGRTRKEEADEVCAKVAEGRWKLGVKKMKAPAVPNSITQTSRNIQSLFDQLI